MSDRGMKDAKGRWALAVGRAGRVWRRVAWTVADEREVVRCGRVVRGRARDDERGCSDGRDREIQLRKM